MSILTKILAFLLSAVSLLLVGMVLAFVGNTENYKQAYQDQQSVNMTLQGDMAVKGEQYNTLVKKCSELELKLQQQMQNMEADNSRLAADLRKAERLAQQYQSQADSWKGVMNGFEQCVQNLQASLSATQSQLDQTREKDIKSQKELKELTADLYEKIVQLQSMEAERRRLLEQKKELEQQVASNSTPAREVKPVTPLTRTATPVTQTRPTGSDIKGLVTQVDKNLVTLSVGSADGVQQKMLFHVTRGSQFLCDVVITNVDINRSAGVIDLKVQNPQVGDTASTELY